MATQAQHHGGSAVVAAEVGVVAEVQVAVAEVSADSVVADLAAVEPVVVGKDYILIYCFN